MILNHVAKNIISPNPFFYGSPIPSDRFIGRNLEISHFFEELSSGHSIAILGQPHIGKTSFLRYIQNELVHQKFSRHQPQTDFFSYIDAEILRHLGTAADFWDEAFAPFDRQLQFDSEKMKDILLFFERVKTCKFGTSMLSRFFKLLRDSGKRLILLLDEFDTFLDRPRINNDEFYSGLDSLTSEGEGLILVIASRRNLQRLNDLTRTFNPSGSPYFEIFSEITLGAFSEEDTDELLSYVGSYFSLKDLEFIKAISGSHPYLIQMAAFMLWDAKERSLSGINAYSRVSLDFYGASKRHFKDAWDTWSEKTRRIIAVIGLAQLNSIASKKQICLHEIVEELAKYSEEIEALIKEGIIAQLDSRSWIINQKAFLWWLADKLILKVRDESDFKSWLQEQKIDRLFNHRERERMRIAAIDAFAMCDKGVMTLINNFVSDFEINKTALGPITNSKNKSELKECPAKTKILFLSADPTGASRLRLGEEFREIQAELNLATCRSRLKLELPELSIRPEDISRALLNKKPQIVHFSGHGSVSGALCFEDKIGNAHFVEAEALAALFEQFAQQVECVILNACYSDIQAIAIAQHINYVIGMNQAISDKAAIDFSKGFYQALGAGRSIEEAYKFGCVQIRLQGIPEYLTPVLMKEGKLHSAAKKSGDLSE